MKKQLLRSHYLKYRQIKRRQKIWLLEILFWEKSKSILFILTSRKSKFCGPKRKHFYKAKTITNILEGLQIKKAEFKHA